VLKKIFGRQAVPTDKGNSASSPKFDKVQWVKTFELELSNMEGAPRYKLKHQLTIGSEVGNIVIADPSVSPRHCTFQLQQDVVSVIDHGSMMGTSINGQKIPPGKSIILEENDFVYVGELEIKILTKNESLPPTPEVEEESVPDEEMIPVAPLKKEKTPARELAEKDSEEMIIKVKKNKAPQVRSGYATNSIIRVMAVICDFLLAYSLYTVFSPFDEFRAFLNFVPELISEAFDWNGIWTSIDKDYGFIGEMLEDLYKAIANSFPFVPVFSAFFLIRLISTLLFGVSVSEAVLGVRGLGNFLWKRVGGGLRVIIGMLTWPFVIFDISSIISRRTFKELITFTHTALSSKFAAVFSTILFLPLVMVVTLLAPLFHGMEGPKAISVNDKVEKRIKVTEIETTPGTEIVQGSNFLGLKLAYDPKEISLMPVFKFFGVKDKLKYKVQAAFVHKDQSRVVRMEIFKNFDLQQLLGIGFKGNPFLFDAFPALHNYVYSVDASNFKKEASAANDQKFAEEFIAFTKMTFELEASNALDVMQKYTPLMKGLVDYKSSLLALLEYKEFNEVGFIKLGDTFFMKLSYRRQKPFDLLIPLKMAGGRIYKVVFDKSEDLNALASRFYKYTLDRSVWRVEMKHILSEMSTFQVLDFFGSQVPKEISAERAQALYGFYFEKSAEVLKTSGTVEYDTWKEAVISLFEVIDSLKGEGSVDGEFSPELKLYQNFRDLLDALENKNYEYFGVTQVMSI
jgi:hypothetical protein